MRTPRVLAVLFSLAAAASPLRGGEVVVFAAASLTDALKEIAPAYERVSGDRLVLNLGASSMLARQIREGAPADAFLSADEAQMDGLEKAGLLVPGSRRALLSNTLVIVVATEGGAKIASPGDLKSVRTLALAEPKAVPAGVYAKQYLARLGLWDALAAKVIPTENVRACLAAVESGNADAGIVYRTDALISERVRIAFGVPVEEGPRISYPVAIVKESAHAAAAKRLVAFLASDRARQVFEKFGFLVARERVLRGASSEPRTRTGRKPEGPVLPSAGSRRFS
jgi:molybdate transport system substrate-binding protein